MLTTLLVYLSGYTVFCKKSDPFSLSENFGPNFEFLGKLFSCSPLKLGFFSSNMENNNAVTLQFEDFAVSKYLFFFYVYICW